MKKVLFLPIETIARELDAKLLLAYIALSRDYRVVIGQKSNVRKTAEQIGHGTYLYKSHGLKNFPDSHISEKKKFIYVALDEEGLVFQDDKSFLERAMPDKLEHLKLIFTWGSYQRELLIKENPNLGLKIIPVGNPRFDLLRPEFSSFYSKIKKRLNNIWGRYVLINTNFSAGNFSRHYGCTYIEHREHNILANRGRSLFNNERQLLLKKEKYYKKLFKQYKEMLLNISLKFPELKFILRPHPSEDHENWEEALEGLKNVHVIFEGSSVEWIQGALAVIHTGCTTGIESWALKKPVIIFNPNLEFGMEPELPNKFGLILSDIDKLYSTLERINCGTFKNINYDKKELAELFIESIKGEISANRIINALDKLQNDHDNEYDFSEKDFYKKIKRVESIKNKFKIILLKSIKKYQQKINSLPVKRIGTLIDGRIQKYPGLISQFQKFPELRKKSIQDKFFIFDSILKEKNAGKYTIRGIATDTYIINKRKR